MPDIGIEAFLSHASEEKKTAGIYKSKLNRHGINAFVAHEDIEGGEEWMRMLYDKVRTSDVFLILLSKKYHDAYYTDQETGIAFAFNKLMIPISLDGTTPYGFMSKYQAIKSSYEVTNEEVGKVVSLIYKHQKVWQRVIDKAIQALRHAGSYSDANAIASGLFAHEKFSKKQLNQIAKAAIENDQVRGAWTAYDLAIQVLKENVTKIDPKLIKQLELDKNKKQR